jgi:hypothetical protein
MLDLMSSPGEEPAAHNENDRFWLEVADDPGWDPDAGIGGWAFLDGIGFRYYLAAALLRALRGDVCGCLASQVTPPSKPSHRERFLARWLLDARQRAVLVRIAEHLRDAAFESSDACAFDEWTRVIEAWNDGSSVSP